MEEKLIAYRAIRPDSPEVAVPSLGGHSPWTLNRQTGFNRSLLESSSECGCFHCGRRFPTGLVTKWLSEPGEEDTGLCPYCGKDALVVGDEEHPLSTALLTLLYEWWFREELSERMAETNSSPSFSSSDDYMRKGIPFHLTTKENRREVGKIEVYSYGHSDMSCACDEEYRWITHDLEPGGEWGVRFARDESSGCEEFELVRNDGTIVSFSPWGGNDCKLVFDLVDEYGDRLIGLCGYTGCRTIRLFVDE